ncbi:MAG: histidine phosphatase family protein [Candidatus Amulumruptor caecigallinarius]|nr:histidine phosphatase family protein [Candidatus Amulumruptor caecigallinarius]MCM1397273.1 histidine phosphatase family protein [Candidatus Amulumruptor caecigallinarius]MCM1453662.1 histidine phosphatase family protein [bacterium]
MKLKTTLTALWVIAALGMSGQTTREETIADLNRCGGVYLPYPAPEAQLTAAPRGYEPFYVSHLGRHGSRYLIGDRDLTRWVDVMTQADKAGALTPKGQQVLATLRAFAQEMDGRGGELTPLGERQHKGIARRMAATAPGAFAKGAEVTAVSTPVMRCAYSMMAFTDGLKEANPQLEIPRESSERHRRYLNYHSRESDALNKADSINAPIEALKTRLTHPERLISTLFADSLYAARNIDAPALMHGLYWIAVDLPNSERGTSLYDVFTADELYDLWQIYNFDFFVHNANYTRAGGLHVDNAARLLNDMVTKADSYIADGKHGATLRFAHDGNLIPLAAKMQLDSCWQPATSPEELPGVWANWKVSPMAANIQMIFYRSKANPKDVLVKFLLNENEIGIPVKTDIYPYYRWSDARAHLQKMIDTPFETLGATKTDNTTTR